jgi:hypothetical protein
MSKDKSVALFSWLTEDPITRYCSSRKKAAALEIDRAAWHPTKYHDYAAAS